MRSNIKSDPKEQMKAEKQRFKQRSQEEKGEFEDPSFIERQINLVKEGKQKTL